MAKVKAKAGAKRRAVANVRALNRQELAGTLMAVTRSIETVACLSEVLEQVLLDGRPESNPTVAACMERFVSLELKMVIMRMSSIIENVGGYRYVPLRDYPRFDMSPATNAEDEAPQEPPFRGI